MAQIIIIAWSLLNNRDNRSQLPITNKGYAKTYAEYAQ